MTSRTGNREIKDADTMRRHAFTLIELILVMALLTIVLAVASPSLARFFRARGLDAEARRFLALTRYGQSRAVSEGIPMVMWIDEQERRYGLMAESSYDELDSTSVQFQLAKDLEVEVELPVTGSQYSTPWRRTTQLVGKLPTIRFTPDGFISDTSPPYVLFREGENDLIWIGQSRSRLNYEIQTNQPFLFRR
jgi:type II secretion system protein H